MSCSKLLSMFKISYTSPEHAKCLSVNYSFSICDSDFQARLHENVVGVTETQLFENGSRGETFRKSLIPAKMEKI